MLIDERHYQSTVSSEIDSQDQAGFTVENATAVVISEWDGIRAGRYIE